MHSIKISTLATLSLLVLAACSSPQQLTVHNVDEPIPVSGTLSGWDTSESLIKSTEHVDYYAALDDQFLHLFIDVKSAYQDGLFRQLGLIVYLSNSKDDRKNLGVAYPPGTFNLLRNYSGAFHSFTTDHEWGNNPENRELLNELSEELFSQVMIVERTAGSSNAEYGFINRSQLEIDGMEIAFDEDRRNFSIELKIPIDGSSIYNVNRENIWLGFAVEPPTFRYRDDTSSQTYSSQNRGMYGQRQRSAYRQTQQRLPQEEEWFILRMD